METFVGMYAKLLYMPYTNFISFFEEKFREDLETLKKYIILCKITREKALSQNQIPMIIRIW